MCTSVNSLWLRENTIAVESLADRLTIIPAGAIVDVVAETDPSKDQIEVVWERRRLILRQKYLHGEHLPSLVM